MSFQWPSDTPDDPDVAFREVAKGCLFTGMYHVIAIVILCGLSVLLPLGPLERLAGIFVVLLGVTQFVYMGPAIYYAYQRGDTNVAKGLIIGAAITFVLYGACWALEYRDTLDFMQNGLRIR